MSRPPPARRVEARPTVPPGAMEIDPAEVRPPLQPRRGWFAALCVAFALWVAVLVGMYLKTVYPMRHHAGATPRAATAP